jgi:hypothetical protein
VLQSLHLGPNAVISLSHLLGIDEQYPAAHAIADCLGDRYLYARNMVYANIRERFLEADFQYTAADTRLWRDYQICPLFSLQNLLEGHVVPYVDNVNTVKGLLNRNAAFALSGVLLLHTFKRNYVLHESAHCIAHRVTSEDEQFGQGMSVRKRFVFSALVAESFANAVERLAWCFVGSSTHAVFLSLNSYLEFNPDRQRLFSKAIDTFGLQDIFKLAVLAFLFHNCNPVLAEERALEALTQRVFGRSYLGAGDQELLTKVVREGCGITVGFVQQLTPTYFSFCNCEREFEDLSRCALEPDDGSRFALGSVIDRFVTVVVPCKDVALPTIGSAPTGNGL